MDININHDWDHLINEANQVYDLWKTVGKPHEGFSSKIGFVLAAAGSAVGLGNIWRFPYLAAQYGGAIFLVTYLILVLTFGYALLIAENGIGRMTRKGPIGAYRELCAGKASFLKSIRVGGWINALVPVIIVPYYCVIGGWVTKYVAALCSNPIADFHKDNIVGIIKAKPCISSKRSFVYHQAAANTRLRVMIYACGDDIHACA